MADSVENSLSTQFVIERNQSLSWKGNKVFIFFLAVLTLGIAVVFAFQGLWLILPFAGIEVVALTIGLYCCNLRCRDKEVITIDTEKVLVEEGRRKPNNCWSFNRAWLYVELISPKAHGHPSQLKLRSKGKEIEVGKCLTDNERKSLAKTLASVLEKQLVTS